jgi:hypothetical protein
MSICKKSLFVTTALAAFAATSMAGPVLAADMAVKAPMVKEQPFFTVNDNSVSFTWYPTATDPGVPGGSGSVNGGIPGQSNAFNKYVGSATHFDVWAYGTDFFNIDFIQSDKNDPVGGIAGARGTEEVYGFARSTLSFNSLSHSKWFSSWLFKDISFEWGGDANTQNNQLEPAKKDIVLGAQFGFNLPGTVNLAVLAYKEWSHNAFFAVPFGTPWTVAAGTTNAFTGDREFKWIPRLELGISEPLTFLPWPITFNSATALNFPKGTGISQANLTALCVGNPGCVNTNNADSAFTKVEVLSFNELRLDASKLWWGKPGIWDIYAGYKYWYNKFGTDHTAPLFAQIAPGTSIESTAYLGTTYHFK